jgi:hypothetical protein
MKWLYTKGEPVKVVLSPISLVAINLPHRVNIHSYCLKPSIIIWATVAHSFNLAKVEGIEPLSYTNTFYLY